MITSSEPSPHCLAAVIAASVFTDRRVTHVDKSGGQLRCHTTFGEQMFPSRSVEQNVEPVRRIVTDADNEIGVRHIVDERNVFVANALNVVVAKTVVEHRRAFERLDTNDARSVFVFQIVASPRVPAEPEAETNAASLPGRLAVTWLKTVSRAGPVTA